MSFEKATHQSTSPSPLRPEAVWRTTDGDWFPTFCSILGSRERKLTSYSWSWGFSWQVWTTIHWISPSSPLTLMVDGSFETVPDLRTLCHVRWWNFETMRGLRTLAWSKCGRRMYLKEQICTNYTLILYRYNLGWIMWIFYQQCMLFEYLIVKQQLHHVGRAPWHRG